MLTGCVRCDQGETARERDLRSKLEEATFVMDELTGKHLCALDMMRVSVRLCVLDMMRVSLRRYGLDMIRVSVHLCALDMM